MKAGDALDRAAEIDAYEPGHQKRLEMLKGKIDEGRFNVIASRFKATGEAQPAARTEEKALGAGTLQDLMLQAEILVQYGMRNKALERLQRIQQLFPHEEERNPELQQLYMSAGLMPQYAAAAPAPAPAPRPAQAAASTAAAFEDVSGFARVPEITRKLNREASPQNVLTTTVTEIGTQWNLDRCIAALRKPGLAVSAMKEFVAPGGKAGDAAALNKLLCGLQDLIVSRGPLVYSEVAAASELKELAPQLSSLGVRSLLGLPFTDGNEQLGVLLLQSAAPRSWSPNDVLVFKMIAEQVAIALSNAGLRRLVKNLSVTDENSGLLKRASYLDLLLGEVRRARQQNSAISVLLMRFPKDSADNENTMQRIGQLVTANVRQNDLAFRYAANAVASILGETADKEAQLVVEKMRRLIANAISEKQIAASFNGGIAEAVLRQDYDPIDIVTEVINRAERALEKSVAEGPGKSIALPPNLSVAAVA